MRSGSDDPARLAEVGATELERRLLAAAAREHPSPELTRRMRAALPIAAAATTAAASAHAGMATSSLAAPAIAKAAGAKLVATWTTAALLTAGAIGGVAGVSLFSAARAPHPPLATRPVASEPRLPAAAPALVPVATPPSDPPRERPVDAPAATPAPARRRHVGPAVAGDLGEEIALIDGARTASRAGLPSDALALLRRYRQSFPAGTFGPEAAVLEIEALSASGQHERAATLAREFLALHRDSPLAPRVARFTGDGRR